MGDLAPVLADAGHAPWDDYWYESRAIATSAGLRITAESAMAIPAVYACTAVISEDIAKVPLNMYEDLGEQGRRTVTNHPLDELLHDQPNPHQTALEFREMMTAFALLRGKGIAEIVPGPRGPVDQLKPLHPDLVREERTATGPRYVYRDPTRGNIERPLLAEEVFVVRGRFGRAVLDFARETFGLQLAMSQWASTFYGRGARHSGVLQHPKTLSDPARENLRKILGEYSAGGDRQGKPMILEEGMTWQAVTMTAQDADFLLTLQHGNADVARFFRVPLHKINDLARSTNNNIEHQGIEYVTDTMLTWAIRWEQAIRRDLVIAKGRFYAKHLLDALFRGDLATRYAAYALGVQWGWLTRNEVRALEERNPIEGLNEPLTPFNMRDGPKDRRQAGTAEIPEGTAPYLRLIASDAAGRVVRREHGAMTKVAERSAGDAKGWQAGVAEFYGTDWTDHVARALHLPDFVAATYVRAQRDELLEQGPAALEEWVVDRTRSLTNLALEHAGVETGPRLPELAA
jgi:HK97 family phage portal protein